MSAPPYDIIILALPRWDGLYSSTAYSLARELSKHTRVFYIDNPFTWKDFIKGRKSQQIQRRKKALLKGEGSFCHPDPNLPSLFAATPRLVVPVNWLPKGRVYDWISRKNDEKVFQVIKKIIDEFSVTKFVFINSFNPLFGRFFPEWFRPSLFVYQTVDDIKRSQYIQKHGSYLEERMASQADIVLATSRELVKLKSAHAKEVILLPNAADVDLFKTALAPGPVPLELQSIPETAKVVFYMGNICHRIDYEILVRIAMRTTHFLVLVGPCTADTYREVGLDRLHNVILTGQKRMDELPAYVRRADVCIIPFLCNQLTKSIYPLKINEYLSAGKPVVTTKFSEDIATFADVASVCSTTEDFLTQIEVELATDTAEKQRTRVQYASGNNWRARAQELFNIINSRIK
jgi:teichuronic acid biosynthesis glycosyltransferase TuaH